MLRISSLRAAATAALLVIGAQAASAQNLIANGGFETGDLTSWSILGLGSGGTCGSAMNDWEVGVDYNSAHCLGFPGGGPHAGTYSVWSMYDASGAAEYQLSQSFMVPVGVSSAQLNFWYKFNNQSDANRTFGVRVLNGATSLFDQAVAHDGALDWTQVSNDLTSLLNANAGETLTLQFYETIPSAWTGPAGLSVDDVSFDVEASSAPEPASLVLIATGLAGVGVVARRRKNK